jgi:hypothetical protein
MNMYNFLPILTEQTIDLAEVYSHIDEGELQGTLQEAQEFARFYQCKVELYDHQGINRGWVTSENYRIQ